MPRDIACNFDKEVVYYSGNKLVWISNFRNYKGIIHFAKKLDSQPVASSFSILCLYRRKKYENDISYKNFFALFSVMTHLAL